eukprot:CAMPEP_0119323172 /NCGR_PEP_ID=MMETSP1333-20130426/60211_1 /TAXON_ID=418940 /ORGANISM="Scyphosphaera apsteinii, Strain RCC1455" /LENGTH=224 /DNA_ID=CAMNT_0007330563 /DNA_START=158 /DNA_END=832 /DNA_ORIENTATION=+
MPKGLITSLDRSKLDASNDGVFYSSPRLIKHADDKFLTALSALYGRRLASGARLLDLMSAHISHLPAWQKYEFVHGHGMNVDELDANPALTLRFMQDLNKNPTLPFANTSYYDAVLCCAGVQYLQEPERVFAECARALKPNEGMLIVSFTDKFFFEKAIQGWINRGMATRARLVKDYMRAAGGFRDIEVEGDGVSILAQLGSISGLGGDPFCAVIGIRDGSVIE